MEIDPSKLIFYYLLSLKDILLRESSEFVEEAVGRKYNESLLELGKILDLNLGSYKLKGEDVYVDPEDIKYPKIGFLVHLYSNDSTASTAPEKIITDKETDRENVKYKKDNLIQKLDQVLLIIQSFNKNNK